MRLLIIGTLDGQIGAASQIAIAQGATVAQADDIDGGLNNLRSGKGADLVMVDVTLDIPNLMTSRCCTITPRTFVKIHFTSFSINILF